MPPSVNSSSSRLCGLRPSTMCALRTPESSASHGRLELRPHPAGDLARAARAPRSVGLRDRGCRVAGSARQPSTSVRKTSLNAPSASATAAAAVGVHVVGVALDVRADRGHHRDVVLGDVEQHVHVDALDLAHEADVGLPLASCFFTVNSRPSSPQRPTAGCPWRLIRRTMSLFCLPTRTIFATSTVASSDTRRPSTNSHLHAEPLHVARDVGPAAVHHHRVHAHVLEEHDVAGELLAQLGLGHRGAAVLDHDGPAVEVPDVRERLEQRCDVSHDVYSALKLTYSGLRSEKKTSVSPPSPGSVSAYSTSSPWTSSAGRAAPPRRRPTPPDGPRSRGPRRTARRAAKPGRPPAGCGRSWDRRRGART